MDVDDWCLAQTDVELQTGKNGTGYEEWEDSIKEAPATTTIHRVSLIHALVSNPPKTTTTTTTTTSW